MAKGPHATAPRGALCFPTDVPGEVYWDDEAMANFEELPPPPPEPIQLPFPPAAVQQAAGHPPQPAAAAPPPQEQQHG